MPSQRLRGVIAAIATPIDTEGDPDASRFTLLARHLLANGCDGLNVLGTTGEATSFSLRQRSGLMQAAAAAGLPLERMMVGTGAAAAEDAAELTRIAGRLGFAGALVLPPFYYKGVTHDGIVAYVARVLEKADSEIPIYLYNFPALSGVAYDVALVGKLVDAFGDRIAGLKDSSGDLDYARAVAKVAPGFDVFPSNEATLGEARQGGFAGCISATANVNAEHCARVLHEGDDEALALAVSVRKLFDGMALVPAVKALLSHIHADPELAEVLPPLVKTEASEQRRLAAAYDGLVAVPA
jgi:4-hydroxy-tetrahydrodipicolinate synthase